MQFRAGEHPGVAAQPHQPAGDVGASSGGVRRQHREILRHLRTGQRRKRCPRCIPDRRRPGCGERELTSSQCQEWFTPKPAASQTWRSWSRTNSNWRNSFFIFLDSDVNYMFHHCGASELMWCLLPPPGGDTRRPVGQHQLHGPGGGGLHQRSVRTCERPADGRHARRRPR